MHIEGPFIGPHLSDLGIQDVCHQVDWIEAKSWDNLKIHLKLGFFVGSNLDTAKIWCNLSILQDIVNLVSIFVIVIYWFYIVILVIYQFLLVHASII